MTRVEHPAQPEKVVISRAEYETDLKRGYCILEVSPERDLISRNPKDPSQTTTIHLGRVLSYRCMRCKFDAIDGSYRDIDGKLQTGLDKIKAHIRSGNNHPWYFTPFESPYGNVVHVVIEGVTDYTQEPHIKENQQ